MTAWVGLNHFWVWQQQCMLNMSAVWSCYGLFYKHFLLEKVTQCVWWHLQVKAHSNSICSNQYLAGVIRVIELLGLWQLGACKSHNNRAFYHTKSSNNGWSSEDEELNFFLLFFDFYDVFGWMLNLSCSRWTFLQTEISKTLCLHMATSYMQTLHGWKHKSMER